MRSGQYIDYEALAQEAMRGIVRAVLSQVVKFGLFGDHHFYIAFDTKAPGVSLSKRLREKYPVEMTIVLQHRFRDLEVGETGFEVELTFDGIPERLSIPYNAVKVFYDPSVPYGLQFEGSEITADGSRRTGMPSGDAVGSGPISIGPSEKTSLARGETHTSDRRPERPKRSRPEKIDKARTESKVDTPNATIRAAPSLAPATSDQNMVPTEPRGSGKPPAKPPVLADVKARDEIRPDDSGKVVDLSKFRKK